MTIKAFVDTNDQVKLYDCLYYLHPQLWLDNSGQTSKLHSEENWSGYIKYLNDKCQVSTEILQIPQNTGGIYVFFIRGLNIPFCEYYLAYVGRAQITNSENLRKRVKSYLSESKKKNGRIGVCRLFKYWRQYLYVRYYKSTDNEFIKLNESALIKAILPPFNTELTDYKIKEPQKAF